MTRPFPHAPALSKENGEFTGSLFLIKGGLKKPCVILVILVACCSLGHVQERSPAREALKHGTKLKVNGVKAAHGG